MSDRIEAIVNYPFPHSAERVFDSWLRADSIRVWMSAALRAMGLPGELITVEVDPRVGGTFQFSDKRPQGDACHWGTYKIIDRPNCLAFTWNASDQFEPYDDPLSLVTITLTPTDIGCDARLVHSMDAQWIEYLDRTERGWTNMMEHVHKLLSVQI